jgi:hypothetical protein
VIYGEESRGTEIQWLRNETKECNMCILEYYNTGKRGIHSTSRGQAFILVASAQD